MDKVECRFSTGISFGNLIVFDIHKRLIFVSLNNDLTRISEWAVQWKMNFSPDPSKQAQELLFTQKSKFQTIPIIAF